MNILITGNTGLLGHKLTKTLLKKGHFVYGFARGITKNAKRIEHKNFKQIKTDLASAKSVQKAFKSIERTIGLVFHTATVHPSKIRPELGYYMDINFMGAVNLLSECRKQGIKNIIASSSFSVYGKPEYLPIDEKHPTRPRNFYALTKLEADFLFEYHARNMGLNVIVLRYDGIYGMGQSIPGFIEYVFNSFLKNEDIELFNGGKQKRDNVYVDDAVVANLKAMRLIKKIRFDIFNIGGGRPLSALKRAEMAKEALRPDSKIILSRKRNELMDYDIFLDMRKAGRVLGYAPRGLKENIRKMIKEHKNAQAA